MRSTALVCLGIGLASAGCHSHLTPAPPYQANSPWPHFRGDASQDGRAPVSSTTKGGKFWSFQTDRGIFSSPVVGGDGTVYIGSADRTFYALDKSGNVKWKEQTGEIIDSSALLDDRGLVYFGSGDGKLRARDAASGKTLWTSPADAAGVNGSYIDWFEGNVALSPAGDLFVPNDDFFLYQFDRSGNITARHKLPDQIWSSPAFDSVGNTFIGDNNLVAGFGANLWAWDQSGDLLWKTFVGVGSVAASPLLSGGRVIVGCFDGYLRGFGSSDGTQRWQFGARDHLYASPARLKNGIIVQPSTDGSVYGIDESTGALRWTFDSPDPIRSSPAVDQEERIYFGSGGGRLYVLNGDGSLRWAIQLIDGDRNDVNSSPALGKDAIYVGGESGEVFSIPYDYCLHADGQADAHCTVPADAPLPQDGAALLFTTAFGAQLATPPSQLDPNQPITLSLVARASGHNQLALIDPSKTTVTLDPAPAPADAPSVDVAGNGQFLTITPKVPFTVGNDGMVGLTVNVGYLVNPDRSGLKLSGGTAGGTATFALRAPLSPPQAVPAMLTAGQSWQVTRLALPLPTLLPSYNQIGFDSLQYLVSMVVPPGGNNGVGIAWMVGGTLDDSGDVVADPATQALLPLQVTSDGTFTTFVNSNGVSVKVTNIVIPFSSFRMALALGPDGNASGPARLTGSTVCNQIATYGPFLEQLGLCNPASDVLSVVGATNFDAWSGVVPAPGAAGTVVFSSDGTSVTATLTGAQLLKAQHVASLLLVDENGAPLPLDYGLTTTALADSDGMLQTVTVPFGKLTPPATLRAFLMVDTVSLHDDNVTIPTM